jgi:uridine kinase
MANKIIKLHGCSGAGKTTVIRQFMITCILTGEQAAGPNKILYYRYSHPAITEPIFVLGSYISICGGLDTIADAQTVMDLIDKLHPQGHVLMEGLLASTYYGKMGEHSKQFGDDYIYAFLDTPIDVCLERVIARRAAANNTRKFNPDLTRDKWKTINTLRYKLIAQGHNVKDLEWVAYSNNPLLIEWMQTTEDEEATTPTTPLK